MAPPEEFVERIQTRFGLTAYFDLTLSSPNEYEPILAEEFLALLIRLVSERGFCGLTTVEALRRELVQRLAVGDATHSSLLKALPPRLQDNKHVQECLDAVAAFRSPSGMQQVVLSHVFCSSHMMSLCGINVCWSEKNTNFLQKSIVYLSLRDGLLLF
jgi:hypothetical protein